jgi:hypothetical protein
MYKELVSDYLNENKGIITAFILITLLTFPIESIAIPELYGRLYNTVSGGKRSDELLRRVGKIILFIIGIWLFIQVFYYIKNWLIGKILPTYLEFTRRVLFTRIIENYENNYQDIKISKNINRLFGLTRDMKDVFFYVATCLIPLALTIGWAPASVSSRMDNLTCPNQHDPSGEVHSPEASGPRCFKNSSGRELATAFFSNLPINPHITEISLS